MCCLGPLQVVISQLELLSFLATDTSLRSGKDVYVPKQILHITTMPAYLWILFNEILFY